MLQQLSSLPTIKVIVGSMNPVKVSAAKKAITAFFPDAELICQGVDAPSGVSDQPMTEGETRKGALNRVTYCRQQGIKDPTLAADLYIAMEGGVDRFEHGCATFAYVVIGYGEKEFSVGKSCELPLPQSIFNALEQGEELGDVMDRLFNTVNIKQKGGAIGLLTNGHATRESIYTQALTLAMAPLLHAEHYVN